MRIALLILGSCILFAGCKDKDHIPSDILPQKKMQEVLWDMMRADQFLTDYVFSRDSSVNKKERSIELYQKIFATHKISKEEFQQSFTYYRSRPVLFRAVMDSIGKRAPLPATTPPAADTARKPFKAPVKAD